MTITGLICLLYGMLAFLIALAIGAWWANGFWDAIACIAIAFIFSLFAMGMRLFIFVKDIK